VSYRLRLLALALLGSAAPLRAQAPLYTFNGDTNGDFFGKDVRAAGDVDGDGTPDLIIGVPFDDPTGASAGAAYVRSGADGSTLYPLFGDAAADLFGNSVCGAGDVDMDGYDDFAVASPLDDDNGAESGRVRVYSGFDGSVLYTFDGDSPGDQFGTVIANAGDVNMDGFEDLVVGAPFDDDTAADAGSARVLSGFDGSVLYTFFGDDADDRFGTAVAGAGDVNMDGHADVVVGAPRDDDNGSSSGSARVLSGLDGAILYTFFGDSMDDQLGASVAGAGDVDQDGYADVVAGAPQDDDGGAEAGSARVFSGADGSTLYTFSGVAAGERLGTSVAAGDVDADGYSDVVVGVPRAVTAGSQAGAVRVHSGLDGAAMWVFAAIPGEWFGFAVDFLGDLDGDGFGEIAVGAPRSDRGGNGAGSALVQVGGCWHEATNFCIANPSSAGLPARISGLGTTSVARNDFTLAVRDSVPSMFGVFFYGPNQIQVPFGLGFLCVGAGGVGLFRLNPPILGDGLGYLTRLVDFTQFPAASGTGAILPGATWRFQWWYRDPAAGAPFFNLSDGVSATFCP